MSSVSLGVSLLCCLRAFLRAMVGCSSSLQVQPGGAGQLTSPSPPTPAMGNLQAVRNGAHVALTFRGMILRPIFYYSAEVLRQHWVPIGHVSTQLINTSLLLLVLSLSYLAHYFMYDHWNQLLIKLYLKPSLCLCIWENSHWDIWSNNLRKHCKLCSSLRHLKCTLAYSRFWQVLLQREPYSFLSLKVSQFSSAELFYLKIF